MKRKGLILAGGNGTRLAPVTTSISKQLLPIYDKPLIHYPLTTLMLAGMREILIITRSSDLELFKRLLGNGSRLGIEITYKIQKEPNGIAEAFLIGESFIKDSYSALILGDNLFHGHNLMKHLKNASENKKGCTIFLYPVNDRERYGIVSLDKNGNILEIEEKPKYPKSNLAVTGLYLYDDTVIERAKQLKPSSRGELEITSINQSYLKDGLLYSENFGRGMTWLDTGTFDSLHDAGSYIKTLESRQGLKIGCPEEAAWRSGWITDSQLEELAIPLMKSGYGKYLNDLILNK